LFFHRIGHNKSIISTYSGICRTSLRSKAY
jgi:hypothetical protein